MDVLFEFGTATCLLVDEKVRSFDGLMTDFAHDT